MKRLTFSAVYGAPPFFDHSVNSMGHIDVSDIQISKELTKKITIWNEIYQATFDEDLPQSSGFKSPGLLAQFNLEGEFLYKSLQNELNEGYEILYRPVSDD